MLPMDLLSFWFLGNAEARKYWPFPNVFSMSVSYIFKELTKAVFYEICIQKIFCVLHFYSNIFSGARLFYNNMLMWEQITQIKILGSTISHWIQTLYTKLECKCFFGKISHQKVFHKSLENILWNASQADHNHFAVP